MYLYPKCIPCVTQQAITLSEMSGITNPELQKEILYETLEQLLLNKDIQSTPHFSPILQSIVGKHTDVGHSIRQLKQENLKKAKAPVEYLATLIEKASDKLEMAIKASIAGNTIDLGANPNFDIGKEIDLITYKNINLDDLDYFYTDYKNAETILMIGDNYEEALFDKLLIEQLRPKNIIYAVRSSPILNDITLEDAKRLEIDKLCKVIESGSNIAGMDIENATDEFLGLYHSADMVIAKGQGNYETLLNEERPIYFMFKVKCDVIGSVCGHPVGTSILHYHRG